MVLTRSRAAKEEINPNSMDLPDKPTAVKRKASPMQSTAQATKKITKTDVAPDLTTFKTPEHNRNLNTLPTAPEPSLMNLPAVPPPTPVTPATASSTKGSEPLPHSTAASASAFDMSAISTDPAEIEELLSMAPPAPAAFSDVEGSQNPVLDAVKEPLPEDVPLPELATVLLDDDIPNVPPVPSQSSSTLAQPSAPPAPPASLASSAANDGTVVGAPGTQAGDTGPTSATVSTAPSAPPVITAAPMTEPSVPALVSSSTMPVPPHASEIQQQPQQPPHPATSGSKTEDDLHKPEDVFMGSSLREQPLPLLPTPTPPPPTTTITATTDSPHGQGQGILKEAHGNGGGEEKNGGGTVEGWLPQSEANSQRDKEHGGRSGVSMGV
ncbi:hypothetical protein BG004_007519 [Podila humilis]|nr:hypothetical protein BG004_007519 [Podila humilis]